MSRDIVSQTHHFRHFYRALLQTKAEKISGKKLDNVARFYVFQNSYEEKSVVVHSGPN